MTNRFNLPNLGYGMGLRTVHYNHILEHKPTVDWFEIISENFMDTDGKSRRILEKIKADYPVVMHGVSLSIGTVDPLNSDYLKKLKSLAEWLDTPWLSDHLCWTGIAHKNTHDLLPVPYTEDALNHVVDRIKQVQDVLGRPVLMENPSSYLEFTDSTIPEEAFIARMAEAADCGLLLDVNNVYVSCYNHRLDLKRYLDALPMDRVVQIHLAGHSHMGNHIIDTHDGAVIDEVWALYRYVVHKAGAISTMIEWDDKIPSFEDVKAELDKAKAVAESKEGVNDLPQLATPKPDYAPTVMHYTDRLLQMQEAIIGDGNDADANAWIKPKEGFAPAEQLGVYRKGYRVRLCDIVYSDYASLHHYLGETESKKLIDAYVEATPSIWYDIGRYIAPFPDFMRQHSDAFAYELCVLERALSELFHAEETPPLTQKDIAQLTPDTLVNLQLHARKALRLFAFDYPVNGYYQAWRDEHAPAAPEPENTWLAVYRHEDRLWRLDIEQAEYELLSLLFSDVPVGAAMEQLSETHDVPEEAITRWFSRWINNGLLARAA